MRASDDYRRRPTAARHDEAEQAAKAHLRTPAFRTLTVGWILTNFADSLLMLMFGVWVADLTGNVALAGATFAALGIPALASPLLGHLAARVSRRAMLTVTYALGAGFMVPLYVVHDASDVWVSYTITVLHAAVAYVTGGRPGRWSGAGHSRDRAPRPAAGP